MRLLTTAAFAALIFSRILLISIINTIPDMDPSFLRIGATIFETSERTPINLPFAYAALVYWATQAFGFVLATKLIYLIFSVATGWILFLWTRAMFDETVAAHAVLVFTLVPNFTFALAGFSHTMPVGVFLLVASLYGYWRILNGERRVAMWLATAFAALLAALTRPEYALYFATFVAAQIALLAFNRAPRARLPRSLAPLVVLSAVFAAGLIANYSFNLARSSSARPTVFTDAEHSYLTYLHTLSLRAKRGIRDDVAVELGAQAFGDAEANNYSIARAVRNNPKEAAKNVAFNVKELIGNIGHHLFMPFFMLFLVGVGLLAADWSRVWRAQTFLLACLLPCVAAQILFHIEVRYLNPIAVVFAVWAALGLNLMHSKIRKPAATAVFAGLTLMFIIEAVYFSQNPIGQLAVQ